MITPRQLEWAAGFLEGEGSFRFDDRTAIVSAGQNQLEPLTRLKSLFGGSINGPYADSNCSAWALSGIQAAGLMMTLYSLLSPRRRQQILKALGAWRIRPACNRYWKKETHGKAV